MKYGDSNVFDMLKRAPGVTVVNNSIRMRGLGSGYTQILVNGKRALPGFFSMDTLTPDQIEIIRSTKAEFSMQAIAGTVKTACRPRGKTAFTVLRVKAMRSICPHG